MGTEQEEGSTSSLTRVPARRARVLLQSPGTVGAEPQMIGGTLNICERSAGRAVERVPLALAPKLGAVAGVVAEFFFDAEELVVLADAVGAAQGAGLDLAGVHGHDDV